MCSERLLGDVASPWIEQAVRLAPRRGEPPFRLLLLALVFALLVPGANSFGGDWYVRPNGAGSHNGISWNDAWDIGSIGWGSVQPGDTVWLAGGSYANGMVISRNGRAGSPIFIKRVRSSDLVPVAAAGWNIAFDSPVIVAPATTVPCYSTGCSYIYMDGRVDRGISFRLPDAAGENGAVSIFGGGVYIHDLTFTNIDMAGPIPEGTQLSWPATYYCKALKINNAYSGINVSNIVVSHCRMHGATEGAQLGNVYNITFEYCKIYDILFAGAFHPNIWECDNGGPTIVRYCEIWNWVSEGFRAYNNYGTCYFYGNVWRYVNSTGGDRCYAADLSVNNYGGWGPLYSFNETFIGVSLGIYGGFGSESPAKAGSQSRNCIFVNSAVGAAATDCDYGAFYNSGPVTGAHSISTTTAAFVDFANNDFHLVNTVGSTYPRNKGVGLSVPYNLDMDNVTRGADGAWDIGAYEYGSGIVLTNPIISVSPGSLSFGPVASNLTVTNVVTVQNVGAGTLAGSASVSAPFSVAYGGNYSLGANQSQAVGIRYTAQNANDSGVVTFTGGGGASVPVNGQLLVALPGLSFESYAGFITAPFSTNGGYVSQSIETTVDAGGSAVYSFTIVSPGSYVVQASINAPSDAANSFFVNMDGQPTDPTMIWDIPLTTGFEPRNVSWRGNGTFDNNEFSPKVFSLTAGTHQLVIRGREADVQLGRIAILKLPPAPTNLRVAGN